MMSSNPYLFVVAELIGDEEVQGESARFSGKNSLVGASTSSLQSVRVKNGDEECE